ncbi:hypothetical protein POM88_028319 [Heracleum sosnowskyi]|uniref:Uncharacterized protein n=1 Tax=Heracleum sosnowskyi TaxID=360622 RepID=A0AAD8IA13_9APIA|nr:hypothetical protein POM88_028319 [Heracleum sosnowskyi]
MLGPKGGATSKAVVGFRLGIGVDTTAFADWLDDKFKLFQGDNRKILVITCWATWKVQNELVWKKNGSSVAAVGILAHNFLSQWSQAQDKNDVPTAAFLRTRDGSEKWIKPVGDVVIINVDAALFTEKVIVLASRLTLFRSMTRGFMIGNLLQLKVFSSPPFLRVKNDGALYYQLVYETSRVVTACDDSGQQSFNVVLNPYDGRSDSIGIEADIVSVNDTRFHDCWPRVEDNGWSSLKLKLIKSKLKNELKLKGSK